MPGRRANHKREGVGVCIKVAGGPQDPLGRAASFRMHVTPNEQSRRKNGAGWRASMSMSIGKAWAIPSNIKSCADDMEMLRRVSQ